MKQLKLLKSIIIVTPMVSVPLLAASCGKKESDKRPATNINPIPKKLDGATLTNQGYLSYFSSNFKTVMDESAVQTAITAQSKSPDPQSRTVNITTYVNSAIEKAKEALSKTTTKFNPDEFAKIAITVAATNNVSLAKNEDNEYLLSVYPNYILNGEKSESVTFNFALDSATASTAINFTISSGFINYTSSSGGLSSNDILQVTQVNNTIFALTDKTLEVGAKQADGSYNFTQYTINSGQGGCVAMGIPTTNQDTVYVATQQFGIFAGIMQRSGRYTFNKMTTTKGTAPNFITTMSCKSDGSLLYVGTFTSGFSVLETNGATYAVENTYTDQLTSPRINQIYDQNDGAKIYLATANGVSVGTKGSTATSYSFENFKFNSGDPNWFVANIACITAQSDGTVYAGTPSGITTINSSGTTGQITKKDTNPELPSDDIISLSNNGANSIYIGTNAGLAVATKSGNIYDVNAYKTGLTGTSINNIYINRDARIIILATGSENGGVSISKNNWYN